jgi:hypothetical protein
MSMVVDHGCIIVPYRGVIVPDHGGIIVPTYKIVLANRSTYLPMAVFK